MATTPTVILSLVQAHPDTVASATQKLKKEVATLTPGKIRETAQVTQPPGGDCPIVSDTSESGVLRLIMGAAQQHGVAEGKAMTKYQLSIMSTLVSVLWLVSMGFGMSIWNDMKTRVGKHDEQIQTILQDGNGQKARELDYVRRLDKIETKQDVANDKLNEVLTEVKGLKK